LFHSMIEAKLRKDGDQLLHEAQALN
jgi:hypothetical protein